ncbi:MAG: hypothetical protein MJ137_04160, partial [Clostridia bacterium]|nr:hypothetical protein [Clostridia bacterium]
RNEKRQAAQQQQVHTGVQKRNMSVSRQYRKFRGRQSEKKWESAKPEQSRRGPGCPYDNGCAQSFFATAKKELVNFQRSPIYKPKISLKKFKKTLDNPSFFWYNIAR